MTVQGNSGHSSSLKQWRSPRFPGQTDVGVVRFRDAQNAADTVKEILDNGIGVRKRTFQLSRYSRE